MARRLFLLLSAIWLVLPTGAIAATATGGDLPLTVVAPPKAYIEFCFRQPEECPAVTTARDPVAQPDPARAAAAEFWRQVFIAGAPGSVERPADAASVQSLPAPPHDQPDRLLDRVNRDVNRAVHARADMDVHAVSDYWDLPLVNGSREGDCEDFVLEKRRALRLLGYSQNLLSIALVRTRSGQNHAVLVVATPHGEVIMDNLSPRVEPWDRTSYALIARQSAEDPGVWVGRTR